MESERERKETSLCVGTPQFVGLKIDSMVQMVMLSQSEQQKLENVQNYNNRQTHTTHQLSPNTLLIDSNKINILNNRKIHGFKGKKMSGEPSFLYNMNPLLTHKSKYGSDSANSPTTACENHFSQEALFYLHLQQQRQISKTWYCRNCAFNLYKQGFEVFAVQESKNGQTFIERYEQIMRQVNNELEKLSDRSFIHQYQQKKIQVNAKYEELCESLMKVKKIQLIQFQKLKFDMYQDKIKKEKQLETIQKKLQLLKQSYLDNVFEKGEKKQRNMKFYWSILHKEQSILEDTLQQMNSVSWRCSSFSKQQICNRVIQALHK